MSILETASAIRREIGLRVPGAVGGPASCVRRGLTLVTPLRPLLSAAGIAALGFTAVFMAPAVAPPAEALTVTQSVTKLAGNFADDTDYTDRTYASSVVSTLVTPGGTIPDAIGASRTFTVHYAALLAADKDANGTATTTTGTRTASYRVSFSVTAGAGVQYVIVVNSKMLGELTAVGDEDGTGNGTISNVTGTYTGAGTQTGSLNLATATTNTSAGTAGVAADVSISQNGTLTITGLLGTGAAQNFTLDFTWTMSATSTTAGNDQGDEAAVRLGQDALTTLTGTTAGSYPGGVTDVPSRISTCTTTPPDFGSCDGHTVTVSITEVPAPPTLSLLGLGLAAGGGGIYWRRWRRR